MKISTSMTHNDAEAMLDCWLAYGVQIGEAIKAIRPMAQRGSNTSKSATLCEVYGSGHISQAAMEARRNLNIKKVSVVSI